MDKSNIDTFILYLISDAEKQLKLIEKSEELESRYVEYDSAYNIDKTINETLLNDFKINENPNLTTDLSNTLKRVFQRKGNVMEIPDSNIFYFDITSVDKMSIKEMNSLSDLSPMLDFFFTSLKRYDIFSKLISKYEHESIRNGYNSDLLYLIKRNAYLNYIPNKIGIVVQSVLKPSLDELLYKKNITGKEIYFFTNFKTPRFHIYDVFNIPDLLNTDDISSLL